MKLHSDIIVASDFHASIRRAVAADLIPSETYAETTTQGSRSRSGGVTFKLGSYAPNRDRNSGTHGALSGDKAASWDDHGHVFAELFRLDPHAIIGYYDGVDDFHVKTDYKYATDAERSRRVDR